MLQTVSYLLLSLLAILPALIFLCYLLSFPLSLQSTYKPFLHGVLLAIAVVPIELIIESLLTAYIEEATALALLLSFAGAAIPEEIGRFVIIHSYVAREVKSDVIREYLIFGGIASLGFAFTENIGYILFYEIIGPFKVAAFRAFTAVLMHGLNGLIMAFFFSFVILKPRYREPYLMLALLVPILLHGFYNTSLLMPYRFMYPLALFVLVLQTVFARGIFKQVKHQQI